MFEGNIQMYEETIFMSTKTKTGYDRILKKIDPLIRSMSSKVYIPGYSNEDIRQEVARIAIEGIDSYDSTKNVRLSTFLHIHLRNKIISLIKHHNKISNDASTSFDADLGTCECGGKIIFKKDSDNKDLSGECFECTSCKKESQNSYRRSREELVFSSIPVDDSEESSDFQSKLSTDDNIFYRDGYSGDVDIDAVLRKIREDIDAKTAHVLKRICVDGLSIKDAASEVGLTGWAASVKIKKLANNDDIKTLLRKAM
jgi:DNA-directed RNA polymerase specialized sigma subunit